MALRDFFASLSDTAAGPSKRPVAIVPSDTIDLAVLPKRLFVGTGGNVAIVPAEGGTTVVYKNVGDGVYLNVRPSRVMATGTTAADIIAEG